jgi:hypothetical protein
VENEKRKKEKKAHHGQARAATEFLKKGKTQVLKVADYFLTY